MRSIISWLLFDGKLVVVVGMVESGGDRSGERARVVEAICRRLEAEGTFLWPVCQYEGRWKLS